MTKAGTLQVIFDLGGVLIDWNPRYLYRSCSPATSAAMERFLAEICSPDWNLALDAGRALRRGRGRAGRRHPHERERIEAYQRALARDGGGPDRTAPSTLLERAATRPACPCGR